MNSGPYVFGDEGEYGWIERHIRVGHGILGALYPQRLWVAPPWNETHVEKGEGEKTRVRHLFTEGGGTASWLGLVNKGLFDADHINWGGWGGRYGLEKEQVPAGQHLVDTLEKDYEPFLMYPQARDHSWAHEGDIAETEFSGVTGSVVYTNEDFAPIWRWRDALTRDFQARMDWCVCEPRQADHAPQLDLFGDKNRTALRVEAAPGEALAFDASASVSTAGPLSYRWYTYPEAGTYAGALPDELGTAADTSFTVPADAAGKQIHVILEGTSAGERVPLTSYRRIVIDVVA
ncbi:MAG: nucleoside hydrolase-like domain-containing protein, partial [Pseudomonadota bacterium]